MFLVCVNSFGSGKEEESEETAEFQEALNRGNDMLGDSPTSGNYSCENLVSLGNNVGETIINQSPNHHE